MEKKKYLCICYLSKKLSGPEKSPGKVTKFAMNVIYFAEDSPLLTGPESVMPFMTKRPCVSWLLFCGASDCPDR